VTRIRVLPEALANKIAAGEVVERPASIAKELLENAVDAEARSIFVQLEAGGRKRIRVVDDGAGMEPDDLFLALERHATSKISREEDLYSVRSLGFRGEALPSIAAVSLMELESRVREREVGRRIRVDGGVVRKVEEISMQPGTRVTVSNLFHNTPARRKFLKSVETETAHVLDAFTRTALSLPNVHFRMDVDGRGNMDFPPCSSVKERLHLLWGREITERLLELSSGPETPRLHGYLVPPEISRTAPRYLFTYVNGRWVRDRWLHGAVLEAYRPFLTKGRYPLAALFLEVDPQAVDVNVHPSKAEVRFRSPRDIRELLVSAVRGALTRRGRASLAYRQDPWEGAFEPRSETRPAPFPRNRSSRELSNGTRGFPRRWNVSESGSSTALSQVEQPFPEVAPEALSVSRRFHENDLHPPAAAALQEPRVLGQLANRYILCEAAEGLLIVDQHAAHERILFEALKKGLEAVPAPRQLLAIPRVLELGPSEFQQWTLVQPILEAAGLELHPFGERTLMVRDVPVLLEHVDVGALVEELLDTLEDDSRREIVHEPLDRVLAVMACHASIRSGQALMQEEMSRLVRDLTNLPGPFHCPHGRPIWKHISYEYLERELKRR